MKKYLAKVTLVASITLLFSFGLNVQAAHAFGWLSPNGLTNILVTINLNSKNRLRPKLLSKHHLNNLLLLLILGQALPGLQLNLAI